MGLKSNFRTTGISCLLAVLVAASGAISPAQANVPVPTDGEYVCTTGALSVGYDTSRKYLILNGAVKNGDNCRGDVVIPEGVTSIGTHAFNGASALTSITIPTSVTSIGELAFALTSALTSITIPEGVTSIPEGLFYGASSLTSFTIPASVTSIGEYAFAFTSALTSITIPEGVTSIPEGLFYDATALMDVNFLGDAPSIVAASAFVGNASGAKANISATASGFGTGPTWNGLVLVRATASTLANGEYVCTTGALLVDGDTSPTYTINNGVVSSAEDCTGAVTIAPGVTEIAESAFEGASGMSSVSIPASATKIGSCDMAATSITVDSANPNYSSIDGVLLNKDATSLIAYPTANTAISYIIPSSVTKITYCTFYKTKFLKSINIPNSVTSIEEWAFADMPNVETVTFAAGSPITRIEAFTFAGLAKLNSITLPSNLEFIGEYVFVGNTSLTSVTIPEGVTSIGSYAFNNASALTSITIPAAVTSIENSFAGAISLAAIYVDPNNQTYSSIDGVLFNEGATTLIRYPAGKTQTSYTIPASVTSIGSYAFANASALTSITIPASVATIEDNSFSVTPLLMDYFFLGDAPTNLGADSFAGVASGARARISATATGFGTDTTWNGLEIVRAASVPDNGPYVCMTGELRAPDDTSPSYAINNGAVSSGGNCYGDVVLPDGVTSIADFAFRYTGSLNSINIPPSVATIGDAAFQLSGLTSITFAPLSMLTRIEGYAFSYASSLTSINIPASVTSIGSGAFANTTSLTAVSLPSAITTIADETFMDATALASIVIPGNVATIEEGAFSGATSLASITIPASVTTIGDYAFFDAMALMDVNFSGNAPANVGEAAFFMTASGAKANISAAATGFGTQPTWNGLVVVKALPANGAYVCTTGVLRAGSDETSPTYTINNGSVDDGYGCAGAVVIPAGVTSIEERAFDEATALTSITIPASVTSIENYAFKESGLTTITFAQGSQLATIGDSAFSYTALTSITIPEGVTSIGEYAFSDASSLTSITIPSSVTSIGESAFEDSSSLAAINVDSNNQTFGSIAGVLFNKDVTTLLVYPVGKTETSYTIPEGVTSIGEDAFAGATALTSVTIPEGVTSIGAEAFYEATGLTSITIPEGVISIGANAFYGTTALTSITIPASVTTIEGWAFEDASALIDYNFLGNAPTNVDEDAFEAIASGAKANISATATGFGTDATWNGLVIVRAIPVPTITTWPTASGIVSGQALSDATLSGGLASVPGSFAFAEPTTIPTVGSASHQVVFTPTDTTNYTTVTSSVEVTVTQPTSRPEPTPSASVAPIVAPKKITITGFVAKFPAGASSLTKDGKAAIKKIVNKSGTDATFTITGIATKVTGVPDSRAKALAKARAEKVKAYLIKLGVKKSNISIKIKIVESGVIPKTKIMAKYLNK